MTKKKGVNVLSLYYIMYKKYLFEFLRSTCMSTLSVNTGKQNHLSSAQCVCAIHILSLLKIVTQLTKVAHTVYIHYCY